MAEKVEEIAKLLEVLKKDSEANAEDFNNLLTDIKFKLENLSSNDIEFASTVGDLGRLIAARAENDEEKFVTFSERLKALEVLVGDTSVKTNERLQDEVGSLSSNIKEAVGSVVKFANQDAEAKKTLFEKVTSLENAVKNDETADIIKNKYNELLKSFEHFSADANLRNGNIISAISDLGHVMGENSAKNSYMIESLNTALTINTDKVASLDGTVASQFATVNSKLFSLGDDVQKTLNEGFEHLKYLSANLSDHMNSNSIDMKTSLECLRANFSDYCEQLKTGLQEFGAEVGSKVEDVSGRYTKDTEMFLGELNTLSSKFDEQSKGYEESLKDGVAKLYEFLTVFRDAVLSVNDENKEILSAGFTAFETSLGNSYTEYKDIVDNLRARVEDVKTVVRETSDSVALRVANSSSEVINSVKNDLILASEHNLESIIGKIDENTTQLNEFKESIADKLSEYLNSVKDLFVNYSEIMTSFVKDDEILEKVTKVEELILKNIEERTANFNFVMSGIESSKESVVKLSEFVKSAHSEQTESLNELKALIENNSESEQSVEQLGALIREQSFDKDEKIDSLRTIIEDYKKSVDKLTDDFAVQSGNNTFDLSVLKDVTNEILPKLENLRKLDEIFSKNSAEFKETLGAEAQDIKSSISEVVKAVSELPVNDNAEVLKKLLDFEVQLGEASETYESNLDNLRVVLKHYAENSEKINADTDLKLQASIEDIRKMQENFDMLADKMSTLIGESGLIEILANIRQQFNTVLTQLRTEKEELASDLNDTFNDGVSSISSNLYLIGQNLEEVRVKQSENAEYLHGNFEEKMLGLQADIDRTVSNVKDIIDEKSELMLEAFNPVKEALTDYASFDYEQIVSDIKNQIEISYVNLTETINLAMEQGVTFELVDGLYKEAVSKLTAFEQSVKEMAEDNFEYIKLTLMDITTHVQGTFTLSENIKGILETDLKQIQKDILENRELVKTSLADLLAGIKNGIAGKSGFNPEELRTALTPLFDNEEVLSVIKLLDKNLAAKIDEFKQDHTLESQDILDIINSVNNTVDYTLEVINEKFGTVTLTQQDLLNKVETLNSKLDVLAMDDDTEIIEAIQELRKDIHTSKYLPEIHAETFEKLVKEINSKLDIIAQSDNFELQSSVEDIKQTLYSMENKLVNTDVQDLIQVVNNKLDVIAQDDNSEIEAEISDIKQTLASLENRLADTAVSDLIHAIDNKLDVIAQDDNLELAEGIEQVNQQINTLHTDIQSANESNSKLEDLINTLHNKVDVIAMADDSSVQDEISEIRNLIEGQISNDNSHHVNESLQNLLTGISEIDLSKQAGEIKESVISAIVTLTNDISFVEETEEIKDFVSERTNELHRTMMDVKHQLSTLTSAGDGMDFYTYTLQDVESDLAKLRLILKDMSGESSANEICVISGNILKISKTLESLKDAFNEAEARRLANVDITEQVVSISSRLNQLILNKKEIDDVVLERLTAATSKLDNIDTSDVTKGIEEVLVSMDEKLAYSNNLNTVLKNVMMYLGEWMDGTTETISAIYDKSAKINTVSSALDELKQSVPDKQELISTIENKFVEQDLKIAKLEEQLNRISGMISSKSDAAVLDRIDVIDHKLERLSENIEKLASYVE